MALILAQGNFIIMDYYICFACVFIKYKFGEMTLPWILMSPFRSVLLNGGPFITCIIFTNRENNIFGILTHISLSSFLWDICKQNRPRYDAANCVVPSGVIQFAYMNLIEE